MSENLPASRDKSPRSLPWKRWAFVALMLMSGFVTVLVAKYFETSEWAHCPQCGLVVRELYFSPDQLKLMELSHTARMLDAFLGFVARHPELCTDLDAETMEKVRLVSTFTLRGLRIRVIGRPEPPRTYSSVLVDDPPMLVKLDEADGETELDAEALEWASQQGEIREERRRESRQRLRKLVSRLGPNALRCPVCRSADLLPLDETTWTY